MDAAHGGVLFARSLRDFLAMTEPVQGGAIGTCFMRVWVIPAICVLIVLSFILWECCKTRFRVEIFLLHVAGKKDQSTPLQNTRQLPSGRSNDTTCMHNGISSKVSDESQQEGIQGNQVDWSSLNETSAFRVSELSLYQTAVYTALEKVEQLTREKKFGVVQTTATYTRTSNHKCVSVDDSC